MADSNEKFIPSKKWQGAKLGYVFRTSKQFGLGYHLDIEKEPFVASDEWRGARQGYVFRKSKEFGLGYHRDDVADCIHISSSSSIGNDSKRRRTFVPLIELSPEQLAGLSASINCLTNDILMNVADYLPKTSRALFAVALTASSSSWGKLRWKGIPNEASKAIVSSVKPSKPPASLIEALRRENAGAAMGLRLRRSDTWRWRSCGSILKEEIESQIIDYYERECWDILDFVDIEKSLASRLSDDDIGAILVCIDAKNILKRLNLTHCFGVIGHGLSPLHSSLVLEKIDMSLARQFERPKVFVNAKISDEAVLPIIDSILGEEGNSFRRLQVPAKWCEGGNTSERLLQSLEHHNYLANWNSLCCYFGLTGTPKEHALQIGHDRMSDDFVWDPVDRCLCSKKEFIPCEHCDRVFCLDCGDGNFYRCYDCGIASCRRCSDGLNGSSENVVSSCSANHGDNYCTECRSRSCREGTIDCGKCLALVLAEVLEENNAQQEENNANRMEIKQVRRENDAQREEIEQLRREVKDLRERSTARESGGSSWRRTRSRGCW